MKKYLLISIFALLFCSCVKSKIFLYEVEGSEEFPNSSLTINEIKSEGSDFLFDFNINSRERKNLIEKASIAINGVSLTVSKKTKKGFKVWIIPHTLKLTNLSKAKKNDFVNIEIDILSKYVRNYFNEK